MLDVAKQISLIYPDCNSHYTLGKFGSLAHLKLEELPDPQLQAGEVLIKVLAASINPSDVKNVQGNMEGTTLPRTPGRDFAGVVVAGADDLIGLEVWGTGGDVGFVRDGSHAEYMVLPTAAIKAKPNTLSMEEAASIGVTYVTAWLAIADAAHLTSDDTLLVIGATGGVGSAAVQIAKWKGAQVIGTVRRDSDADFAREIGVNTVVNLESKPLAQSVMDATNSQGATIILDTVGGSMMVACLDALSHKGRLLEITAPKESQVCFDMRDFYHRQARLIGVDSRASNVVACAQILEALIPGFESGALKLHATTTSYALKDAVQAYEQIQNKTVRGRVVLVP